MNRQDVLDALVAILAVEGPLPAEDADLFQAGVIDSFRLITLVIQLEERFGMKFAEQNLTGDNLRTLDAIATLVLDAQAA